MRSMLTILFAILLVAPRAAAQSWTPPAESQRCPSKWGAGDERGSGNLMKPEQVLKATKLIRSGEVIELEELAFPERAADEHPDEAYERTAAVESPDQQ